MKFQLRFIAPLLALALIPATAHDDLLGSHYVAANGVDSDACHHAAEPCRTLAYAQQHSFEGDTIKVAEGYYYPTDRELAELFYSPVKLVGGYSTADHFSTQDTAAHPTYLVAPKRFESAARARGFQFLSNGDGPSDQLGLSVAGIAPPSNCVQGAAGVFPCRNVDLLAHIPLSSFSSRPVSAADLWGFVDRNDNREYVVIGLANGTAIVEITDPANPREAAFVAGRSSLWREPTVHQIFDSVANRYRAYAYVSTEALDGSVEVIDMSNLPSSVVRVTQLADIRRAHTVYVSNVEYAGNTRNTSLPAFLVVAGADTGGGALRMYDLTTPTAPRLVASPAAGYMHDSTSLIVTDSRAAQCPSGRNPCEVLADFNENTVDLWDVSNKATPMRMSSVTFPTARYVHSGWPSDDGRYIFVHDELDELRISGLPTQIYTLDIASLTNPTIRTSYVGPTTTTDHNGYVKGDRFYVAHYRRGLVVFDVTNPNALREVGNFDSFINPNTDVAGTDGNWGAYPFFPSGVVAISDIDNGLFILRDNTRNLQNRVGRIGFGATSIAVGEAQVEAAIAVRRVDGRQGALSVDYATSANTATDADFRTVAGTLTWSDGDDADKFIRVPLTNDGNVESAESFTVALSNLSATTTLDGASSLTVTINDDDVAQSSGGGGGGSLSIGALIALLALFAQRRQLRERNKNHQPEVDGATFMTMRL